MAQYNPSANTVLVLLGPTASGKTALAVQLAFALDAEIVSADSRQLYKGMDLGTGKDLAEYQVHQNTIPYHMIDVLEVGQQYHVHQFRKDASKCIELILQRGKQAILCGGSGMYIDSLLSDFSYAGIPQDKALREALESKQHRELLDIFESYKPTPVLHTADLSTHKRTVRAIEIAEYLKLNPDFVAEKIPQFQYRIFGLNPHIVERRKRINKRLHERLQQGMVEEIEALLAKYGAAVLLRYGLEYKYITQYLTGELSYDQMQQQLNTAIHQFAKRQMTYFRKMERDGKQINWIPDGLTILQQRDFVLEELAKCR